MQTVAPELTARDLTYILNSLHASRSKLMDQLGDEAGDEYEDLVTINELIERLRSAHRAAGGRSLSEAQA